MEKLQDIGIYAFLMFTAGWPVTGMGRWTGAPKIARASGRRTAHAKPWHGDSRQPFFCALGALKVWAVVTHF